MEAAAEAAQAQFSNMEAAMRQQLSQFRANASSDGSLTDDVMGQPPPPARPPARWLRTPSECTRRSACPFARPAGFYHAVDWSEPWLKGLLAFHVTVWVLAIATPNLNPKPNPDPDPDPNPNPNPNLSPYPNPNPNPTRCWPSRRAS